MKAIPLIGTTIALLGTPAAARAAVVRIVPDEPLTLFITGGSFAPVPFDLDGNGVVDYEFRRSTVDVRLIPENENRVLAVGELIPTSVQNIPVDSFIGPPAIPPAEWVGSYISSATGLLTGPTFLTCVSGGPVACVGQFAGAEGYFGLEFDIGGQTHYGWVRGRGEEFFQGMTLYEWAYESEPGVGLRAGAIPEPAGPLLVLAGLALAAPRRRNSLRNPTTV